MVKRVLSLVLVFAAACALLCGCTNQTGTTETTKETIPPMDIMQKTDPAQDEELNILMIGNSFCYYYVEELYGMLTAAGYKNVNVCNVYYSGCPLEKHWQWWKSGEANYDYYTTNETGRNGIKSTNLEYCLNQRNWDIISLQEASSSIRIQSNRDVQAHMQLTQTYRTDLWGYLKEQFPMSRYFWHQTWANQIGYDRNNYQVESLQQQEEDMLIAKEFSVAICKEQKLERINTGEAWQIVRRGGYDNLCARLSVNAGEGDYYHDGDIGGGQYLNACVWFEAITGQSCVGNTYRPDYALDGNLIPTLQAAAHKAIEQRNAEDNK